MLKRYSVVNILISVLTLAGLCQGQDIAAFAGQDLHLAAGGMTVYQSPGGSDEHLLVFNADFSMSIGANQLSSDAAVVWIKTVSQDYRGGRHLDHNAQIYLEGNVTLTQGGSALTTKLSQLVIQQGHALVARFLITGQVFATADTRNVAPISDLATLPLYQNAIAALMPVKAEPQIAPEALVPQLATEKQPAGAGEEPLAEPVVPPAVAQVQFEYPVYLSAVGGGRPQIENSSSQDGEVTTVTGRFYLWQKQDEMGSLLEFQADNAVIFHGSERFSPSDSPGQGVMASGDVDAVYFQGNIVLLENGRTIRADEIYYDFNRKQCLAVNAEMRNFDERRGLPVYLRAVELRQVSENTFNADQVVLTSSEFYIPQVALNASKLVLIDTTGVDARSGKKVKDSSYDATLYDVDMQLDQRTVFSWPKIRTNLQRPDIPLKKLRVGRDSDFGTSVETRWHPYRLLGRKQPDGIDSTLALDYFGKRGTGAGLEVEYKKPNYSGDVIAYVLNDRGEDDLGRTSDRQDLEPDENLRGRFKFQHRHYLPYDWQAIAEMSYSSDQHFLEWFYESEFDVGKEQETLLYLKRLKDNWAFSILNKIRINDYAAKLEELPTVEFHLKGQSFGDDKLTFYSDSQVSRFRQRLAVDDTSSDPEQFFAFASTRNEVDMPFAWNTIKMVPFVANTYAYEDQKGYYTDVDNGAVGLEKSVWVNEVGLRAATMFFKQDQFIRSRLLDINGIRHIVKPHLEVVFYDHSDESAEMRNIVNVGLAQRWQSRRGPKEKLHNFDWMRLNVDATWVDHDRDSTVGPTHLIWNNPAIPIAMRRSPSTVGALRDSITADYTWRLSDTSMLLSDIHYDTRSGFIHQFNIGMSRYIHPDISYYIANRYLREVVVSNTTDNIYEKGSNSVVAAITYSLNPRYTAILSQEYNFDYGQSVRSELTILRRYHRMYYGLTYTMDATRDRQSIVFSVWPQGIKDLAFGERKFVGLIDQPRED
jgi:lipopolysaccharide assembly outer membrane protein LptD (OstA)